jgi:hypothetical protein
MRRAGVVAGAAAVAVAGGAVVAVTRGGGPVQPARADGAQVPVGTTTVPVRHGTLTARESADGTLGYAGAHTVAAGAAGTVTHAPAEGSVRSTCWRAGGPPGAT